MKHVVILGCGIIGATLAYELSQVPGYQITVIDPRPPATGATQAALGVLMGTISQKLKGRAWQLRRASMERYQTLIPELERKTGREIPGNHQGILLLCSETDDLQKWQHLVTVRQSQGLSLEIWPVNQLQDQCPHLNYQGIQAGIYSPDDRQFDPVDLTLALVAGAELNGVQFHWETTVDQYVVTTSDNTFHRCVEIQFHHSISGSQPVDWLVVAAGLGSSQVLASLPTSSEMQEKLEIPRIRPVLGQALQVHCDQPLGNAQFQPVITYNDVHLVPVGESDYWVGATVEFPSENDQVSADPTKLATVFQKAVEFCPQLAHSQPVHQWSGLRPRPDGVPAPVLGKYQGYDNVLLATGHYRNGILLAPGTAQVICDLIRV